MTGYIILAGFIVLAISHASLFFMGYSRAQKKAEAERKEEECRRLQSEREFQRKKEEIKQEVFGNAEEKKALLSAGGSGRDNFNAINDSLRGNPRD
jgi:hypothetical protein